MGTRHTVDDVVMTDDLHNHPFNGSAIDLNPDGAGHNFTGIDPKGIALDGEEIVICNDSGTHSVNLIHNNGSFDPGSAVGNRFFFADNADKVLAPYQQVWGIYREDVPGRIGWWLQF